MQSLSAERKVSGVFGRSGNSPSGRPSLHASSSRRKFPGRSCLLDPLCPPTRLVGSAGSPKPETRYSAPQDVNGCCSLQPSSRERPLAWLLRATRRFHLSVSLVPAGPRWDPLRSPLTQQLAPSAVWCVRIKDGRSEGYQAGSGEPQDAHPAPRLPEYPRS